MDEHWDPNMLITCPYDEVHRIAACRFQKHILKCRKNHPEKDTVSCPYNATHILMRPNLREHLGNCPDRVAIEPDVIQARCDETGEVLRLMGNVSIPERRQQSLDAHEDWDMEAEQYEQEKVMQKYAKPQDNQKQNFRRPQEYSNVPTRDVNSDVNLPSTRKPEETKHLKAREEQRDSTSYQIPSSIHVRLAGRGRKPIDAYDKNSNADVPPGRSNTQFRSATTFGRGRGTNLLKKISTS